MYASKLAEIVLLAWPISVSSVLTYGINTLTLAFVGHLGSEQMAGFALGNMSVTLSGLAVIFGILCGMDTLCSQVRIFAFH